MTERALSEEMEEAARLASRMVASGTAHGFPHAGDVLDGEQPPKPDDPAAYVYCGDCDGMAADVSPVLRSLVLQAQRATARRCLDIYYAADHDCDPDAVIMKEFGLDD